MVICHYTEPNWISRCIAHAQGPGTVISHVGILYSEGIECEALSRVRIGPIRPGRKIIFDLGLTPEEQVQVQLRCLKYLNKKYGYLKILGHLGDHLLSHLLLGREPYFFRRLCFMDDYPICSWLVCHVLKGIRTVCDLPLRAAQPDDIYDYLRSIHAPAREIAI